MPLLKTESKFFIFLVGFSAITVATCAAIFSVTGLSMLYSGAMLFIAIAMGTLEFSKIVVASYLFRHWKDTAKSLKFYLSGALVILMIVTSGGIYGYLTSAYQGATIGIEKINFQTNLLESSKDRLYLERERISNDLDRLRQERQQTIENRNEEISLITITDTTRYYDRLQRQKIYDRYDEELKGVDNNISNGNTNLDSVNTKISLIETQLVDKKLEMIDVGADTGPLVYMARIFNTSMDNVMKWFTLVIVLVFDPLAVALVLALNNILIQRQDNRQDNQRWIKTNNLDDEDDFDFGWIKTNNLDDEDNSNFEDDFDESLDNVSPYDFSPTPVIKKEKNLWTEDKKVEENPLTDDEIRKMVEDAKEKVYYQPGGKVTVDHSKQEE